MTYTSGIQAGVRVPPGVLEIIFGFTRRLLVMYVNLINIVNFLRKVNSQGHIQVSPQESRT
jgi:hypothetical protein